MSARGLGYTALAAGLSTAGRQAGRDIYNYVRPMKKTPMNRRKRTWTRKKRSSTVSRALTSSKRYQDTINGTSRLGHSLNENHLTNLSQGTTLDDRERQQVFVKGVKIAGWMDTLAAQSSASRLIVARCALVQAKYSQFTTYTMDKDFFQGMVNTNATDFTSHSNGLNTLTLPINRRKLNVIREWKMSLNENAGYFESQPKHRFFEEYVPINKMVTYDGTSNADVDNPIYFVWWYEYPDHAAAGATATAIVQDRWIFNLEYHDVL